MVGMGIPQMTTIIQLQTNQTMMMMDALRTTYHPDYKLQRTVNNDGTLTLAYVGESDALRLTVPADHVQGAGDTAKITAGASGNRLVPTDVQYTRTLTNASTNAQHTEVTPIAGRVEVLGVDLRERTYVGTQIDASTGSLYVKVREKDGREITVLSHSHLSAETLAKLDATASPAIALSDRNLPPVERTLRTENEDNAIHKFHLQSGERLTAVHNGGWFGQDYVTVLTANGHSERRDVDGNWEKLADAVLQKDPSAPEQKAAVPAASPTSTPSDSFARTPTALSARISSSLAAISSHIPPLSVALPAPDKAAAVTADAPALAASNPTAGKPTIPADIDVTTTDGLSTLAGKMSTAAGLEGIRKDLRDAHIQVADNADAVQVLQAINAVRTPKQYTRSN